MLEKLISFDIDFFLFLNGFHNPFMDKIMWWTSATVTWVPLYLVVLFFIFKQLKWKGLLTFLFLVLVVVLADQGSVQLFKNVFQRLRPCHNTQISDIVHIVNGKCGGKIQLFYCFLGGFCIVQQNIFGRTFSGRCYWRCNIGCGNWSFCI